MEHIIPILVILSIIALYVAWVQKGLRRQKQEQENARRDREGVVQDAHQIIIEHIDTLHTKRLQKMRRDDYGVTIDNQWIKEIDYFYENVLLPQLGSRYGLSIAFLTPSKTRTDVKYLSRDVVTQLVNIEIDSYSASKPFRDVDAMSPIAFEAYCAQLLNEAGWQATTTKGSGDQGIDIIATKNGVKAVFQCKKYSSPVGTKAVQEAIAGRSYASADHAFVVSNAEFTRAALELSQKAGVHLIHYSSLLDLSRYFST